MRKRLALGLFVLLAAVSAGAQPVQAGLRFCNDNSARLEVAISYPDGKGGWIAEGWWLIDGGQCQDVIVGPPENRYYYYFVHGPDGPMVSGDMRYCIQAEKFKLNQERFGARTEPDCAQAGLRVEKFKSLDTGGSKNHTVLLEGKPSVPASAGPAPQSVPPPAVAGGGPAPARGWLGVSIQEVTGEIADSLGMRKARGALVRNLYGNGPAKSGGIKVGDVIVEFDGHDIKETRDLVRVVPDTPVGKDVQVVVIRAGNEETMTVKVRARVVGLLPGAVAAGKCDRLGYALGYDNFDAAAAAALQDCASNGDRSCKLILTIQNNCASVAVDSTCHARGWANGSESQLAEEQALASCARQGGRDCKVIQTICDAD